MFLKVVFSLFLPRQSSSTPCEGSQPLHSMFFYTKSGGTCNSRGLWSEISLRSSYLQDTESDCTISILIKGLERPWREKTSVIYFIQEPSKDTILLKKNTGSFVNLPAILVKGNKSSYEPTCGWLYFPLRFIFFTASGKRNACTWHYDFNGADRLNLQGVKLCTSC